MIRYPAYKRLDSALITIIVQQCANERRCACCLGGAGERICSYGVLARRGEVSGLQIDVLCLANSVAILARRLVGAGRAEGK